MKTAIRKIFNKYCTQVNMDYNEYIVLKPDEFIKEIAELFASQNPERVMDKIIELSLDFQKEYLPNAGASYHYQAEAWAGIKEFTVWLNQKHISDLCSGSQEKERQMTDEQLPLYQCPYSKATKCNLADPCLGCETRAETMKID